MILQFRRLINIFEPFHSRKFVHTYLFKMDKAYLRRLNDTEQFEFAFRYIDHDLKIDRQFNFNRRLTENIDAFLTRVTTNFEKVASKKLKKKKKKTGTPIEEEEEIKTDVRLFSDNNEVAKDSICNDVFVPGRHIILKLASTKYEIVINSPWIDSISLPTSMLATFPAYPSKFETVFTDKELSTFVWSKSKDKKIWTDISNDFICVPSNEEIEHYLKLSCTPKNCSSEGPCTETISECKVEASPGKCPFETRHEFTKERSAGNE